MGASATFAGRGVAAPSRLQWKERRDLFAEGVASGDPDSHSVLLWTRVSNAGTAPSVALTVEVAADAGFKKVVATAKTEALLAADHTCRVLVGGLEPSKIYWYRFVLESGDGSRIGRTRTAPADDDGRPIAFAFVSCQNIVEGSQHAYRRMIFGDEARPEAEQLAFVLHLGDFVYEVVDYPEDAKDGRRYNRKLRDVIRYKNGEKVAGAFHVPTTLEDYRTLYRAYLHDPDIQDARAHFPFVLMWDNHEFSWMGFQSFQRFEGKLRPAQPMKVAANQTWFEYQPARVVQRTSKSLASFDAPAVKNAPIETFDENGLGTEPNNLAAIESLRAYRALRFGRPFELIITDQYSHRSEEPSFRAEANDLGVADFPYLVPEESVEMLDAGRSYDNGKPKAMIPIGDKTIPNFRRTEHAHTMLRAEGVVHRPPEELARDLEGLGELSRIARPARRSPESSQGPGGPLARRRIRALWRDRVAFVTGSICSPGLAEALEHNFPKDHPLRPLFMPEIAGKLQPAVNLLMHHGVRSCLEYARTGDAAAARRVSNPDVAPHTKFLDMAGHGYATVRLTADAAECEFVCIPRPIERNESKNGGPLRYRVSHRAPLWKSGESPTLEQRVIEGDPALSL